MKAITDATIRQITRNLREFGYDGLTDQAVREQVEAVMTGERPANVIGMFARTMLVKNGYLADPDDADEDRP